MTRDDAISKLRRQLPSLRDIGITGLSLTGDAARNGTSGIGEIEVVLDIDLAAHPDFDLLALVGVENDLEDDLGVPVRAFVVGPGMRTATREAIIRGAIPIAS